MNNQVQRRHFIKGASGTLGLCLASQIAPAYGAAGANEKINLGFIACGGRNSYHMRGFQKIGGVNIVAVCDVDRNHLDRGAELAGGNVKKFKDF